MKRAYICNGEMERSKWLELYFDDKKDFTQLKKALKTVGWKKPWGHTSKDFDNEKTHLPDAFDNFDYDKDSMEDIPKYYQSDLQGPDGTDLFSGWTATEARKNTRLLKKELQNLGWEIWTWKKTYGDMEIWYEFTRSP